MPLVLGPIAKQPAAGALLSGRGPQANQGDWQMAILMLSNLHPDTTEEQVREFLERYGFPPFDAIERQEGDGTRPGMTLTFNTVDMAALQHFVPRIHGVFWNGHKLNALLLRERFN